MKIFVVVGCLLVCSWLFIGVEHLHAQDKTEYLEQVGPVQFQGKIADAKDLSALGVVGDFLITATDGGCDIQLSKARGAHFEVIHELPLGQPGEDVDIEGIACRDGIVYVTGSHNRVRKKWKEKDGDSVTAIRKHLANIEPQPARAQFFRFRLTAEGKIEKFEKRTLSKFIDRDPVLSIFSRVPCKENGVDIEGLAEHEGKLYFGFRGPVLRGDLVPILTCKFDNPDATAELLYVKLQGLGVRDLVRIDDGFLILAGPVSAAPAPFHLYYWNGMDGLMKQSNSPVKLLGTVTGPPGAKAEGLTVLQSHADHYQLLIVHDGVAGGAPMRYRLRKGW